MRSPALRTETALVAVILVAGAVFAVGSPYFLTVPNFADLFEAHAVTTILAAGVFVVLVSGGIDISFTATAAVAQYLAALAASRHGASPAETIAIACGAGLLLGSVNALLTHYLRVAAIIVTIATASIYYALLIHFTGGTEIYDLPAWWKTRIVFARWDFAPGEFARLTLPIVVMVAVVVMTHFLMTRTRIGRQVYMLGGNADAARRLGVRVLGVQLFAYGYLGLLAGVAGLLQAHRVGQAVPTAMAGSELNVLAVAILGGASLVGGLGTMTGVVLGVLLLAMLQNGLNLMGVSSYFFQVVIGLAILVSTTATALSERRARQARRGG